MYILIYIHRVIDSRIMSKRYKLKFKNSLKSLDELAQTDTLIMDDYFFLDKTFNPEDFHYVLSDDAPLAHQLPLILRLIDESPLLREHMLGHTVPISKYFRLHRPEAARRAKVRILREAALDDSTLQVTIRVVERGAEEERYAVRFSDRPVGSTIQKIRERGLR